MSPRPAWILLLLSIVWLGMPVPTSAGTGSQTPPASLPVPRTPLPATLELPDPRAVASGTQVSDPAAGTITTLAGGSADGASPMASTFFQPWYGLVGPDGSVVVVDTHNNRIRAYDPAGGPVRTLAGSGDAGFSGDGGLATHASLNFPMGAAFGPGGDLYIADTWNDAVRRVDAQTGRIATVAGVGPNPDFAGAGCGDDVGVPATEARVCHPAGVAVGDDGDLFISSQDPGQVLRVDAATGIISEIAEIDVPWGLAVDSLGNLIVSQGGNWIEYVNLGSEPVTLYPEGPVPVTVPPGARRPIAGRGQRAIEGDEGDGGPATQAKITFVKGFGVAADGDLLLAEDAKTWDGIELKMYFTMLVRRIDWDTGIISTIAGNKTIGAGGENDPALESALSYPVTAFEGSDGDVLVVDRGNTRLRRLRKADRTMHTEAGAGLGDGLPAPRAHLCWPSAVASGPGIDYFGDGCNLRIRAVFADGIVRTVGGADPPCVLQGVGMQPCGGINGDGGPAAEAGFPWPTGLDLSGNGLLATVSEGRLRMVNLSDEERVVYPESDDPIVLSPGEVDHVAGYGPEEVPLTGSVDAREAYIGSPYDVAFAPDGNLVFTDERHGRLLRIDSTDGRLSLLAGVGPATQYDRYLTYLDGPARLSRFSAPRGVAVAPDGMVYVADTGNARIRKIDPALEVVTTVAGAGVHGFAGDGGPAALALLGAPEGISVAPDGAIIVADTWNHRIRRIDPATRIITTLAGSGPGALVLPACGSQNPCGHYAGDGGAATEARLNFPADAVVTADGRLLIADRENHRIRVVALV